MDAALKKAKDSIGQLFDKNMQDLVRGIRNHKDNEAKYISECIDEIKQELKQNNISVKANAISKLCYLQMLGYDISWAAFNIIEVMSSTKFTYKRIGYLAASQSFHDGTDVLMLTTNMIRKDLNSQNMYESGIALSGLSCFISHDLARDLANEIMTLMTSSKAYIRKKSVLIMYKIFLKYPDALRPAFQRLKEKLEDTDPGVQAAAVNVICELARKNPQNYLSLAPTFFNLMNSSTNNWVLIKIIKLFGALTPLESRLGKKLIEPLTNLINSTSAMSLLYECINTVIAVLVSISSGLPNHNAAIQLCLQKLRILIEDSDQNLKYLGLLAMSKILQTNPKSVQTHKDLIMQCLDDKDESIRLRALNLLYGMVSKKTLMEIIKKLLTHMNKAEGSHYRDQLLCKIIEICSQNNYQYITNFEWYISVLVELTRMDGIKHGKLISSQLLDVTIRVESIREFSVKQMCLLLENMHLFSTSSTTNNDINEVLYAAAWICGEFSQFISKPIELIDDMLKPKINTLSPHIQSIFIHNIFKLYSIQVNYYTNNDNENNDEQHKVNLIKELTNNLLNKLSQFEHNSDLEVQERSCMIIQILKYIQRNIDKNENNINDIIYEIKCLFDGELNPVAPKAQIKVPLPDGLDLDSWINEPPSESESEDSNEQQIFIKEQKMSFNNNNNNRYSLSNTTLTNSNNDYDYDNKQKHTNNTELNETQIKTLREARQLENESNPYYIKSSTNKKKNSTENILLNNQAKTNYNEKQSTITTSSSFNIPGITSSDSYYRMSKIDNENKKLKKKMKKPKRDKKSGKNKIEVEDDDDEDDYDSKKNLVTIVGNEMPDGANESDSENKKTNNNNDDPYKALNINLDEPLRDDEKLPIPKHRDAKSSYMLKNDNTEKSKKKVSTNDTNKAFENEMETQKEKSLTKKTTKKIKHEKKHHRKSKTNKSEVNLITDYNELISPEPEEQQVSNINNIKEETNQALKVYELSKEQNNKEEEDLNFWLKNSSTENEKMLQNDTKKEKKTKKEKSKKHKKNAEIEIIDKIKNNETEKCIESNNKFGYNDLVSNKHLKLLYKIEPNYMNRNQLIVNLSINTLFDTNDYNEQVYSIEINILDTINTKLIKESNIDSNGTIKIPNCLTHNSNYEFKLYFTIEDCTFPQKIKGTLTYMYKSDKIQSLQDKLDFKLEFLCSSYLIDNKCDSNQFTEWLTNGELNSKCSVKFQINANKTSHLDFKQLINYLCSKINFNVVEIIENSTTLFSTTIKNQPICLLVKLFPDNIITIDGKSVNNNLVYNIVEECKALLQS